MKNKICTFFGHRQIEDKYNLEQKISLLVDDLMKDNFQIFLFGGFGEFDELCHKVVSQKKKLYPNLIRIYCLIDEKHLLPNKRPKYLLDNDYENFVYYEPDFDYWYKRIYFRNCEMIKHSNFVVFFAEDKENSGAYKMLKFAKKIKKPFINLKV